MLKAVLFALACVAIVGTVPALYLGALLAQGGALWLFPAPALVCVLVSGALFATAEDLLTA